MQAAGLLGALGVCTFLAVRAIGRPEIRLAKKRGIQYLQQRKRDAECRTAGHRALERMQHAQKAAAFWEIFCEAAGDLRIDRASMTIRRAPTAPQEVSHSFTWAGNGDNGYQDADCPLWSASFPLVNGKEWFGVLRVSKATNGLPLGPSVPEMLELLRTGLTENLARVGTQPTLVAPPAELADLAQWSATVS